MRLLNILTTLCATALAATELIDSTIISIQPVSSTPSTPPTQLAEIKYNPSTLAAEILSFTLPELDESTKLLRVGVWDPVVGKWMSSTSSVSVGTFEKGVRQTVVLSLDAEGGVLGVGVKGAVIDAGQSREFGPRVLVRGMGGLRGVVLNRPVVLNPEGKVDVPEVEKTLLQKYWWVLLGGVMLLMTTGGGAE